MPYKNKEDKKEYDKNYRLNNHEAILARDKKYRVKNAGKIVEYQKQYRKNNKEKKIEYNKQYYKDNKEKILNENILWGINNIERRDVIANRYRQSSKGKLSLQKQEAKRRQLGFIPLNKPFVNYEGHHISENFIIYIPKKIHQSIWHNIWTWRGMNEINKLAIEHL